MASRALSIFEWIFATSLLPSTHFHYFLVKFQKIAADTSVKRDFKI